MPYFTLTIHEVEYLEGPAPDVPDGEKLEQERDARAKLFNTYDQFHDGDARGSIGIGLGDVTERLKAELRLAKLDSNNSKVRTDQDEV